MTPNLKQRMISGMMPELKQRVLQAIQDGLVQRKPSTVYEGLSSLKYAPKVFYDGLWDDVTVMCRGIVVDEEMNVIARPFDKVFNYGERGAVIPHDEICTGYRKTNGFMFHATYSTKLGCVVSGTTGTTDSKYAELGRTYLTPNVTTVFEELPDHTFIFECCDPSDPHVIPETTGLYLLAVRSVNEPDEYVSPSTLSAIADWMMARRIDENYASVFHHNAITATFGAFVDASRLIDHEGYVVYSKSTCIKLKSPYYLVTKFIGRIGTEKLVGLFSNPKKFKERFDEEYWPLLAHVRANFDKFAVMHEQGRMQYIRNYLDSMVMVDYKTDKDEQHDPA